MAVCQNEETGELKRPIPGSFLRQNRVRPLESSKFLSFHEGVAAAIRVANGEGGNAFASVHDVSKFRCFPEERNHQEGVISVPTADSVPYKGESTA